MKTYLYAKGNPVLVTIHEVIPKLILTQAIDRQTFRLLFLSQLLTHEDIILMLLLDGCFVINSLLWHDRKNGREYVCCAKSCLDEEQGTPVGNALGVKLGGH